MKKNGFVFVETIVAVVILTSSLLLLYSSFTNVLLGEKTRVYYDDVNYIYRSWYLKETLNNLNFNSVIRDLTSNDNRYFVTVGIEYQNLFNGYEQEKDMVSSLINDFEVTQMIVLKENKLDNLKSCTKECSNDKNCKDYENCNNLYTNLNETMISYIKTMYIDVPCSYVFVAEYNTCNAGNKNCHRYYSWVSV